MTTDSPFRRRSLTRLGLAVAALVWVSVAWAGDRRDIVFECPCSAVWSPDQDGGSGTLTLTAGIRSFRATESGRISLAHRSSDGVLVGTLSGRDQLRDEWEIPISRSEARRTVIEIKLQEETGRHAVGSSQWQVHEWLALWPDKSTAELETRRYVDILTDTDADGVGDVNERFAGTSWEDSE